MVPDRIVVEQSRATFDCGLARYKSHADKQYSLVDCVSFELMMRDGIAEALTDDHHFEQAGFIARLRARVT
jgi:predicted nucleic acid-binding protein